MPSDIDLWSKLLRESGQRPGVVLGAGMEGTVVELSDGMVAKVWYRRSAVELQTLKVFSDAVATAGLPFATPVILDVIPLGDLWATVEKRLDGGTLWRSVEGVSPPPDAKRLDCLTTVLAALIAVNPTPAMGLLPILDGEAPFDTAGTTFEKSLAQLVERRVTTFETSLAARLPDLDALTLAVVDALNGLAPARPALVHGDLVPANVLTGGDMRPTAVLDFGFMTTIGDPSYDAAIAASIFDMYGPDAGAHEARLSRAFEERFDYDAARLETYRAAYALSTSNCFSPSGTDGHFDWCVRLLARTRTREVLGL